MFLYMIRKYSSSLTECNILRWGYSFCNPPELAHSSQMKFIYYLFRSKEGKYIYFLIIILVCFTKFQQKKDVNVINKFFMISLSSFI